MKKYLNLAMIYMVIGLIGGIFYREFTKFSGFDGETTLKAIHPHALILGFGVFMGILVLDKLWAISKAKSFKLWIITYNIGIIYLLVMLLVRGVLQVKGLEFAGLSHMAGLGHAIMGGALIWLMLLLRQTIKE